MGLRVDCFLQLLAARINGPTVPPMHEGCQPPFTPLPTCSGHVIDELEGILQGSPSAAFCETPCEKNDAKRFTIPNEVGDLSQ